MHQEYITDEIQQLLENPQQARDGAFIETDDETNRVMDH
jgi:hypothetical protein